MAEILTESFCERCGTRYTFQTAAPRARRFARLRVASKGLRNYVLEDGSSLDDAFSEARNEEERAISGQQLEAFHKTFNFCLSCRQYTCGNCWNAAENRCLSCAPDLSREVMPAPFPDLVAQAPDSAVWPERDALADLAWPEADLARSDVGTEGPAPDVLEPAARVTSPVEGVAGESDISAVPSDQPEIGAPAFALAGALAAEPGAEAEAVAEPEPAAGQEAEIVAGAEAAALEAEPEAVAGSVAEPEAVAAEAEPEAVGEELADAAAAAALAAAAAATAEEPEPARERQPSTESEDRAVKAAAATALLFGRFRPGQNLDAALDAYERGETIPAPEATETELAPSIAEEERTTRAPELEIATAAVAAAADAAAEPEPVPVSAAGAAPEPEAEPAVIPEPEPEPEPEPVVAATEPEPIAPAEPEPPVAPSPPRPSRDDRVELPVWTIVAPDNQGPTPAATPAWPPVVPPPAAGSPAWPAAAWAVPDQPIAAVRAREAMWAESSRDVIDRTPTGVQSCVSCGLPLSATARFCRRCGSRQG